MLSIETTPLLVGRVDGNAEGPYHRTPWSGDRAVGIHTSVFENRAVEEGFIRSAWLIEDDPFMLASRRLPVPGFTHRLEYRSANSKGNSVRTEATTALMVLGTWIEDEGLFGPPLNVLNMGPTRLYITLNIADHSLKLV